MYFYYNELLRELLFLTTVPNSTVSFGDFFFYFFFEIRIYQESVSAWLHVQLYIYIIINPISLSALLLSTTIYRHNLPAQTSSTSGVDVQVECSSIVQHDSHKSLCLQIQSGIV